MISPPGTEEEKIYPNASELISRIEISGSSFSGEQDLEEVNHLIGQYDNYQLRVVSSVETRSVWYRV